MKGESDKQVGTTDKQKECYPGQVKTKPDRFRQADGMAHDALDQQLLTDKMAAGKAQREQPVDCRRFPLEESFTVKSQRQATKNQTAKQRQPLAFFKFFLYCKQAAIYQQGSSNQHGSSAKDAAQSPCLPQYFNLSGLELEDNKE